MRREGRGGEGRRKGEVKGERGGGGREEEWGGEDEGG